MSNIKERLTASHNVFLFNKTLVSTGKRLLQDALHEIIRLQSIIDELHKSNNSKVLTETIKQLKCELEEVPSLTQVSYLNGIDVGKHWGQRGSVELIRKAIAKAIREYGSDINDWPFSIDKGLDQLLDVPPKGWISELSEDMEK